MIETDKQPLGVFQSVSGLIALDAQWRFVYVDESLPQSLLGASLWEQYPQLIDTPFAAQVQAAMHTHAASTCATWGREIHCCPTPGGLSIYWFPSSLTAAASSPGAAASSSCANSERRAGGGRSPANRVNAHKALHDLTTRAKSFAAQAASSAKASRRAAAERVAYTSEAGHVAATIRARIAENRRILALLEQASQSLGQVETRFNLALSVINEAFWDLDLRTGAMWRSESYARIFSLPIPPTPSTIDWWTARLHPEDRQRVHDSFQQALSGADDRWYCDYRLRAGDGFYRYVSDRAAIIRDETGAAVRATGAILDLTELKQQEEALRAMEAGRIESAAQVEVQRKLLEQREMERLQIARDLHDGPLQGVSGLAFSLQMIREMVTDPGIQEMLQALSKDVHAQAAELRAICNELRPPLIDRFGLLKALQTLATDYRDRHPTPQLDLILPQNAALALPQPVEIALYRILQEALNNAARHAAASRVRAELTITPGQVILTIADDGAGLPTPIDWVALARHGHLGLVGMKERAEAIGGALHVKTRPGAGTTITVVVPVPD